MMTQRNVELQLQALDLLERRQQSQSLDEEKGPETVEETLVSKLNFQRYFR